MTAGRKGSWSDGGTTDGELLAATADRLRWHAPELTLVLARQAATRADETRDRVLALRAKSLVVAALVRLGKHADAVEPAVSALREAQTAGERELAGSIRVDLAASTRAVGLAGSAFVLVRPMLEETDVRPVVRAGALAEIVAGLAQAGRLEVIDEVLSEADRLYAADDRLSSDIRRVLRALLCARIASFRRRWGSPTGAVAAATEGMTLLDGLADPATDAGQARAELGLEMVSALLDAGEQTAALGQAEQTLNQPVRAASAAAIGRLMLILATRVHFPAGRAKEAHTLLAEIVRVAHRHELDGLLADVLTSLASAQEADGDLTEALNSLRSAHAAEQRRLRTDTLARLIVLEELGAGTRLPDDTEALLRRVVRTPARTMPEGSGTDLTSREAASKEMSGRELAGRDIGPGPRPRPNRGTGTYDSVGYERAPGETDDQAGVHAATSGTQDRNLSAGYPATHGHPATQAYDLEGYPTMGGMSYGTTGGGAGGGGGAPTQSESSGLPATGPAAASRQDILGRELAGWEMVARERAAMDLAGQTRAAADLTAADRAAPEWAGSDPAATDKPRRHQANTGTGAATRDWSPADPTTADRGSHSWDTTDPAEQDDTPEWSATTRSTQDRTSADPTTGRTTHGWADENAPEWSATKTPPPSGRATRHRPDTEQDRPDWAASNDPAADRPSQAWTDAESTADSGLPDWASADPAAEDRSSRRRTRAESAADSGIPDWASGDPAAEDRSSRRRTRAESAADSGIPDWASGDPAAEDRSSRRRTRAESAADTGIPDWAGADPAAVDRVASRAAVDRAAVDLDAMDAPTVDLTDAGLPTDHTDTEPEYRKDWAASESESQPPWSAAEPHSQLDWATTASAALAASAAIAAATGAARAELAGADTGNESDERAHRPKGKRSGDAEKPRWPDSAQGERDEETGLLNRQGLRRRLAAARRQSRPTALTLVRLEPSGDAEPESRQSRKDPDSTDRFSAALIKAIDTAGRIPPEIDPDVLSSLADHVRDMAPHDAELARPDEGELAVLLPDTTRDEAEQFAATLRETVSASDWDPQDPARGVSVSTGVAQYQEGTSEDALLSAAREALTSADQEPERPDWQSVEPVYDLPPGDSGYTYIEEYTRLSSDGPDPEMAEYLAGFPLPEVGGQWPSTEDAKFSEHDDADAGEAGRSVLDRLGIARGSGGRRRAPGEFAADQSADFDQYAINQPVRSYSNTGDEILAAAEEAERSSIPQPPDPDEVPAPPDEPAIPTPPGGPEVPVPPDPDVEPRPGRRRRPPEPTDPEEDPAADPKPGRRFPLGPDIPNPDDPDMDPNPGRRRWTSELDPDNPRARRRALPRDPSRRAVEPEENEPADRPGKETPNAQTPPEAPPGKRRAPEPVEDLDNPARTTTPQDPTGRQRMPEPPEEPEPATPTGRRGMPEPENSEAERQGRAGASSESTGRRRMPDSFDSKETAEKATPGEPTARRGMSGPGDSEAGFRGRDSVPGESTGRRRMPEFGSSADNEDRGVRPGESTGRRRMPDVGGSTETVGGSATPGESTGRRGTSGPGDGEAGFRGRESASGEPTGRRGMPEFGSSADNEGSGARPGESTGRRRMPESAGGEAEFPGRDAAPGQSTGRRRMPDVGDSGENAGGGVAPGESTGRRRMPDFPGDNDIPAEPSATSRRRMRESSTPEDFSAPKPTPRRRTSRSDEPDELPESNTRRGRDNDRSADAPESGVSRPETGGRRRKPEAENSDGFENSEIPARPDQVLGDDEPAGRRRAPEQAGASRSARPDTPRPWPDHDSVAHDDVSPAKPETAGRRRKPDAADESENADRRQSPKANPDKASETTDWTRDPLGLDAFFDSQSTRQPHKPSPSTDETDALSAGRPPTPDDTHATEATPESLGLEAILGEETPRTRRERLGLDEAQGDDTPHTRRERLGADEAQNQDVRRTRRDRLGLGEAQGADTRRTRRDRLGVDETQSEHTRHDPLGLEEILGESPRRETPHSPTTKPEATQADREAPGRRRAPDPDTSQAPQEPTTRRSLSEIADGFEEAARRRAPRAREIPQVDEPTRERGTPGEATVRRRFADTAGEFTPASRRETPDEAVARQRQVDEPTDSREVTARQAFADDSGSADRGSRPTPQEDGTRGRFAYSADDPETARRRGTPGEATVQYKLPGEATARQGIPDSADAGPPAEPPAGRRGRPGEATVFQRHADSLDGLDLAGGFGDASSGGASRQSDEFAPTGHGRSPLPPEQSGPVDLDDFPRRRGAQAAVPPEPSPPSDREVFSLGPDGLSRRRDASATADAGATRSEAAPAVGPEPVEGTIQQDDSALVTQVDELSQRRQTERQERQRRRAERTADGAGDQRPSRLRRRERSDVKLADLLAEALVAYQSSTAETPGEDVLSAYQDLETPRGDDTGRQRGETGY
nr:diguanylate cyclase [Kibdelosporangium sp. MJ126-NF4]CEL21344.1 diguanylate cyclase/phosphodiesterase (GGDEF & EAL domains) with PAS/PAC sensor(s) [Kibdelosporangium sp. MJ126-NF4]CTQ96089.1 diguanylate cyclase/phosphodiesterase (GGDEF & EAL domains) with PAS/PAC sensor(s) [Kibdelosporangium sp. MJ126-NF4]